MVDFQSRFRLYGHGYTCPEVKYPVATNRELYHEQAPLLFKRRPKAHDCRMEIVRDYTDRQDWETWLLSRGLSDTCRSVDGLHSKDVEERPRSSKKKPDKLLFNIGLRGRADGDFIYPRGLTVNIDGDIIIADTGNHRIQIMTSFGVFKAKFGKKGSGEGQFDEPTGVTEMPNGDLAVADKNNNRIQVFTSDGDFKYEFPTAHQPYCVASDSSFNLVVSTTNRMIEVYRRGGKLLKCFPIGQKQKGLCGFQICVNDNDEVIVCDPSECSIKYFTYEGKILYKFHPVSNNEGLFMIPSGIFLTPLHQLIVADSLNHTVSLYTERGILLQQLLCPTDDAGAIQTCVVGPEGHLITTEYSVVGAHSLKIFRYRECACHYSRPGSSKRRSPATPT